MTDTQKLIEQVCIDIQTMLIAKNKGYGNSALEPLHIFSRVDASDQLAVRIDDKLSRIAKGDLLAVQGEDYWDTVKDLIGYLILLLVQMRAGRPEGYKEGK